jgi:sugar phosphate isomerase/epimerase
MATIDYSRRNLLRMMGMGAAALTLSDVELFAGARHKAQIALQLYTVRKLFETDFDGTMRKIADMGFVGIETYPLPDNVPLERAGRVIRDVGLKVIGMHTELPVGKQRDDALRMADAYNCDMVIYPGWPQSEKYRNVDEMKQTAEIYNDTAAFLNTRGLHFGLHNHWWEFEKTDGVYPFYYLLEHLDAEVVFEIDTYWAKTGGLNPAKVVRDFGRRAPLLHIKDGPATKGEKAYAQVPAGEGSMDFPAIAAAGGVNIKWMIVEFDEYDKDIFDGIRKSYAFLTKRGLARGKK